MAAQKKQYNRKNTTYKRKTAGNKRTKKDYELWQDIKILLIAAIGIFLFVCNLKWVGAVGNVIANVTFGLFGVLNYIAPLFFAFLIIFSEINAGNSVAVRKTVFLGLLFLLLDMVIDLISGISGKLDKFNIKLLFDHGFTEHKGGGIFASMINYGLLHSISLIGTVLVIMVLSIISLIVITEKSFVKSVKDTTDLVKERSKEDKIFKEELYEDRRQAALRKREEKRLAFENERKERELEEKKRRKELELRKNDEKVLKANKKLVGVTRDTTLTDEAPVMPPVKKNKKTDDIHEITLNGFDEATLSVDYSKIPINGKVDSSSNEDDNDDDIIPGFMENRDEGPSLISSKPKAVNREKGADTSVQSELKPLKPASEYVFPPISLLKKSEKKTTDSASSIRATAQKLQDTLAIFGVEATVTDISQGPTVTRFELQPKLGVKVSRIKSLSDDIKLNLAVSEIRIEAPIPGKAAIGIEVPNKEAQSVALRDIIDTPEFKKFDSKLAFAVGKDIAGKTIVYGIENFPHVLIAGATGSGKSVCINTLIMSIIYKASPEDVKFIMIDPKVVELSVYNDIPHLLLPVVTKVDKAAATINYAVAEMHARFEKFEEFNVRDIAGYNRVIAEKGEDSFNTKMPHIVIIIDEMADLMLQKRKEVEDPICSLAQLARAAGIHLIIATQRPSVDVITGLIKANMPSRIAFAVASQVDSRTILDMAGAEELLGKGDMLFFPKGLKKPVRLQGGFVSDKEVLDVVEFLKRNGSPSYDASIEAKIKECEAKASQGPLGVSNNFDGGDGNDPLFADAGFFIIDNNKASIGNLQRKFKMGFNRAARVMDELAEAGVVGPDQGTKPREIIMSREQFENYLEEYGG